MALPAYNRHGQLIEDAFSNKLKRVITSSLLLILAFVISYSVFQLITWSAGKAMGYKISVNFNGFHATLDYRYWSRLRVIALELPAPVICLIISAFLYRILSRDHQWISTQRLFIFWLMVCFANLFFSGLSTSPIELAVFADEYYNHFSHIAVWLRLDALTMGMVAIISVIGTILFGALIGREVLRFSFSKGLVTTQSGKSSIIFQFFMLPVFISLVPLAILGRGKAIEIIGLTVLNLFVISLGMLIRAAIDTKVVRCKKEDVLNHIPIVEFIVTAAIWFTIYSFFRG